MFYQRLRDLKEDNDLKQSYVANLIGTSENTYGRYERGEKEIPLEKATILAEFYKVSLDYIAGRTNDKRGLTHSELPEKETNILKKFRYLNDERKGQVIGTLNLLFKQQCEEVTKSKEDI